MNSNIRYQNFWSWVIIALSSKTKVSRRSWNNNQYLESTNGKDIIYHNVSLTLADYNADDWKEAKQNLLDFLVPYPYPYEDEDVYDPNLDFEDAMQSCIEDLCDPMMDEDTSFRMGY